LLGDESPKSYNPSSHGGRCLKPLAIIPDMTLCYSVVLRFFLKGPPIRGECGASYRYSENLPIDSGLKPFVVEIKIRGGGGEVNLKIPNNILEIIKI